MCQILVIDTLTKFVNYLKIVFKFQIYVSPYMQINKLKIIIRCKDLRDHWECMILDEIEIKDQYVAKIQQIFN